MMVVVTENLVFKTRLSPHTLRMLILTYLMTTQWSFHDRVFFLAAYFLTFDTKNSITIRDVESYLLEKHKILEFKTLLLY